MPNYLVFCFTVLFIFSSMADAEAFDSLLYPGAEVLQQSTDTVVNERMLLSAPKRVSNNLRFDKDIKLSGMQSSWLLDLGRDADERSVYDFYLNVLREQGRVEFECQQRACGTSTDWANKVFSVAKLTARDSDQFYVAGFLNAPGLNGWLSVYVVKNGRKNKLAYLSYVATDPVPKNTVFKGASWPMHLSATSLSSEQIEFIQVSLKNAPTARLWLSAHALPVEGESIGDSEGLASILARNGIMLSGFRRYLASATSFDLDRLETRAVGPFGEQPKTIDTDTWFTLRLLEP